MTSSSTADVVPVEEPLEERSSKEPEKAPEPPSASISELYQFASPVEKVMLILGTLAATGSGVAMPMMLIAFGNAFDQLGVSETVPGASTSTDMMKDLILTFVWLGLGAWGGRFFYCSAVDYVCHTQLLQYKRNYLKAVLRQDVGWYDTSNPEELATKFSESIVKVQKGLSASTFAMFEGFGYGTGGLIVGFYYQAEVAAITLATVPLLIIPASVIFYIVENGAKVISKSYAKAGGVATEALFSMRTVVSLGLEQTVQDNYSATLSNARRSTVIQATVMGVSVGLALSAYMLMMVAAIIYGGFRLADEMDESSFDYVLNVAGVNYTYCADESTNTLDHIVAGNVCPEPLVPWVMTCNLAGALADAADSSYSNVGECAEGDFTEACANATLLEALGFSTLDGFRSFTEEQAPPDYGNAGYYGCKYDATKMVLAIFAIMMSGEGYSMAGTPMQVFNLARQAVTEILVIINRIPAIDSFSDAGLKPASVRGDVEVRDVVFAYPSAPDHIVCNGYNLSIPAGKTVALCGASGSGKSTIIQLIERFYDPQSGMLTLDGVDIKTLNVKWLRSQLGLVGQEPVLFQGSVAMNIGYGKLGGATQEEIEAAAKDANAHGFITSNLAEGYNTEVGQSGSKLSGGQKQRVAIARAIIKKPAVLLLDEATSALDNESERIVQAALEAVMTTGQRTTIVIAHRLSTIRNADKIAVLESGRVVEEGTYSELMQIGEGGVFHQLAKKQEELAAKDKQAVAEGSTTKGPSEAWAAGAAPSDAAAKGEVVGVVTPDGVVTPGEAKKKKSGGGLFGKKKAEEAKKDEPKEEKAPLKRLFAMQADHAVHLLLMFLLSGAACVGPSVAFYFMVFIMDLLYFSSADQMREDTEYWAAVLGALAGATTLLFMMSGFFNGEAGASLTRKLRAKGMGALVRQDIGFFDIDDNSSAELTGFLAEKVDKVKTLTTEQLDLVAQLLGGVGSCFLIIFWKCSWQLALAWAAIMPIMGVIIQIEMSFMSGGSDEAKKKKGQELTSKKALAEASANKIVGEAVLGIRTVASFNLEQRFYEGFASSSVRVASSGKQDAVVGGFFKGLSIFVMLVCTGGVFYYAVWLANEGHIDMKAAIAPLFVITGAMVPMMKAGALADIKNATVAAVRYFALIDRVPAIDSFSDAGLKPASVRGDVEVRDVVFAYPTAPDHIVCNGYNLSIPAGKTVALCGASGSGKSTIIQLIERFYDPQSGMLTLDGVDIKTLNVKWLRSQLGLVGQEPVLFQGSVAMNIGYGKLGGATQEEIEAAAKDANAHGFITSNLAEGYNTDVGLKGSRLSGGQKQRVAIARAIIKKPAVLLLDEATSALDNESERIVQAALDALMATHARTTIVIAHRLSTIRNADIIAVLNEGKVVERGTHDELLGEGGLYASLVMSS